MNLAIADPPYPPFIGSGGRKNRASRWYGYRQRSSKDRFADRHEAAAEWDDPSRHRALLEQLLDVSDGFAICTSPDGLAAYGHLPREIRIGVWVKPNATPGSHRMRSMWEPVLIYCPDGRRSNRGGRGMIPDVWTGNAPRAGFPGAKPEGFTHWILDCLSYDPSIDAIWDAFPGSGAMTAAITTYAIDKGVNVRLESNGVIRACA